MWLETPVFAEDLETIYQSFGDEWKRMKGKTVLVTGGTGLIGSTLISALLYADQRAGLGLRLLAIVRNRRKAEQKFAPQLSDGSALCLVEGEMEKLPVIAEPVHYIFHAASPTASAFFTSNPVETIKTGIFGTTALLDLAREKKVEGFVYLSSMEAFGTVYSEELLDESRAGELNLSSPRSSYPETKRMCESLIAAYAAEYQVPACSIRLAQTFGPGVDREDRRVSAMMTRCALEGRDIRLATKGASRHPYLYTAQAVTAILTVAWRGAAGQTYNAANPDTYCSIAEMGELVARELAGGSICVQTACEGDPRNYPPDTFLNLDIKKLRALGWEPSGDLLMLFQRMIAAFDMVGGKQ